MGKTIRVAEFKASCLRVIDDMNRDHQPVAITKWGKPIAVLSPVRTDGQARIHRGVTRGTVLRYDDPSHPPSIQANGRPAGIMIKTYGLVSCTWPS